MPVKIPFCSGNVGAERHFAKEAVAFIPTGSVLGALVPVQVGLLTKALVANTGAIKDIAWEAAATILGVLGALVIIEGALCLERAQDVGTSLDAARKQSATMPIL